MGNVGAGVPGAPASRAGWGEQPPGARCGAAQRRGAPAGATGGNSGRQAERVRRRMPGAAARGPAQLRREGGVAAAHLGKRAHEPERRRSRGRCHRQQLVDLLRLPVLICRHWWCRCVRPAPQRATLRPDRVRVKCPHRAAQTGPHPCCRTSAAGSEPPDAPCCPGPCHAIFRQRVWATGAPVSVRV